MTEQWLGIDAGQFFLAHRERDNRNVGCLDALVAEFLVEGTLASPLMVETTAVFLPAEPNFLMSATMVCQSE